MSQSIQAERSIWLTLYDASSPCLFKEVGQQLREALGDVALRIDHIGQSAIPQLATNPTLDIQLSVADFEPASAYELPLAELGYHFAAYRPEKSRRYVRELNLQRSIFIHVRRAGSFHEQFALLYRDYLRAHPEVASNYTDRRLDFTLHYDHTQDDYRRDYTDAMRPFIRHIFAQANQWALNTEWLPGPSDA